jgi:hypothetical protein
MHKIKIVFYKLKGYSCFLKIILNTRFQPLKEPIPSMMVRPKQLEDTDVTHG